YSVLEMHTMLASLIENFEFDPPPTDKKIVRINATTIIPVVDGEEEKGAQLPLRIRPCSERFLT
ncbi:hypothetical protein M422DRAFT_161615, partial [Sphaerobolus stellatus SS14]